MSIISKPYYWRDENVGSAFGTFFQYAGGWVTAGHVIDEMNGEVPPFCKGELINRPGGLDIAFIGCDLSKVKRPIEPEIGMRIVYSGFPNGSPNITHRMGKIWLDKDNDSVGNWIVLHDDGQWPVVAGMSGSAAFTIKDGKWELLGVLVERRHFFDHDSDSKTQVRESSDFQPICEAYDIVKGMV